MHIFSKLWDWFILDKYLGYLSSDTFFVSFLFLAPTFFPVYIFSFFFIIITNVVTGDQSPSSPASRWPGANYGNRTLGVCLTTFLTGHHPPFYCTSVGCLTHTSILSEHFNWAGLKCADCAESFYCILLCLVVIFLGVEVESVICIVLAKQMQSQDD